MMMNIQHAHNAYTHVLVNTSNTPLDLIILLYDGAIDYLHKTIFYINQGNVSPKIHYISKTIAIIEELLASLNMEEGGEIAINLQNLYIYMLKELTIANAKNDVVRIAHIEGLLKELRSAWRQIK
ncbi:MAG: flagellar export chaperone FliS [Nitrospirota bacterium]